MKLPLISESRRAILLVASSVATGTLPFQSNINNYDDNHTSTSQSNLQCWADIICQYTPRELRQTIRDDARMRFLYRGDDFDLTLADNDANTMSRKEEAEEQYLQQQHSRRRIDHPEPDLLLPNTYGDDPAALQYFIDMERKLSMQNQQQSRILALPSNGHIATTDPDEAGKWGPVISVWPLGDEWSYAWPEDHETFYPGSRLSDSYIVNRDLKSALQLNREILFASRSSKRDMVPVDAIGSSIIMQSKEASKPLDVTAWTSAYVCIPKEDTAELLEMLKERGFGL